MEFTIPPVCVLPREFVEEKQVGEFINFAWQVLKSIPSAGRNVVKQELGSIADEMTALGPEEAAKRYIDYLRRRKREKREGDVTD